MKRLLAALSLAALLAIAGVQQASALTYVTAGSALAGNPLHVTVYDGADNPVADATVTWTQNSGAALPATLTATADPAGGFIFNSTVTGSYIIKATVGAASASITLNFTGLKFTVNP
jgi:hypothetical protein